MKSSHFPWFLKWSIVELLALEKGLVNTFVQQMAADPKDLQTCMRVCVCVCPIYLSFFFFCSSLAFCCFSNSISPVIIPPLLSEHHFFSAGLITLLWCACLLRCCPPPQKLISVAFLGLLGYARCSMS